MGQPSPQGIVTCTWEVAGPSEPCCCSGTALEELGGGGRSRCPRSPLGAAVLLPQEPRLCPEARLLSRHLLVRLLTAGRFSVPTPGRGCQPRSVGADAGLGRPGNSPGSHSLPGLRPRPGRLGQRSARGAPRGPSGWGCGGDPGGAGSSSRSADEDAEARGGCRRARGQTPWLGRMPAPPGAARCLCPHRVGEAVVATVGQ